jgi:hypothetical protein
MSFCIYTVLFTLADKEPSENRYIKMFQLWISQLIKKSSVERCIILVDNRTLNFLAESYILNKYLLRKAKFKLDFMTFEPPRNLLEGMIHKYTTFDYDEDFLMYSDVDILTYKPLFFLEIPKKEGIFLHAEGPICEYAEAFTEIMKSNFVRSGQPGFSAGKFVICGKSVRDLLFQKIHEFNNREKFYTIEQPFFNKAIYSLLDTINIETNYIITPKISNNCRDFDEQTTVLVDFQGQPGDGVFHLDKMIDFFAYANVT